jgi:hypothetical protein
MTVSEIGIFSSRLNISLSSAVAKVLESEGDRVRPIAG